MSRTIRVCQVTCILALAPIGSIGLASGVAHAAETALTGKVGGLTADQVAARALLTSPAAEQKEHEVAAARAQLDKAIVDFIPRLSTTASYTRLSPVTNPPLGNLVVAPSPGPAAGQELFAAPVSVRSLENQTTVTTTLSVPLSDYVFRLFQNRDSMRANLVSAENWKKATERKAAYDARARYYGWVRAELDTHVSRLNLDLGKGHLARVEALAAADSASEADVARVQATVAASELVLVQAENLAALERERLRIVMHDPGDRTFEIGEDFDAVPAPEATPDLEALFQKARARRPELVAAAHQITYYEKQASVARAQAYPRLDASASLITANPNSRYFPPQQDFHTSWQAGVQLSFGLNDVLVGSSQARAMDARAAASAAQKKDLVDSLRAECADAVATHRNAVAGVATSARRLTAAETSYRARHERFLSDKATTVELTEAQTELFQARLDAVQARVSIRLARARLAYVGGEGR